MKQYYSTQVWEKRADAMDRPRYPPQADPENLTNEVVLGLLEDIDVPPNDKLVQLGYVRLKRNIASRDTDVGPTNSAAGAAAVVRHMARQATELGAAVAVQGEPDSEPDSAGTAPTEQLSTPMNTQT